MVAQPVPPPPLSVYIHFPWCLQKCPYCDFNSHAVRGDLPEQDYLRALITDLNCAVPLIQGRPVQSLFFGGGTPSLISPQGLQHFLDTLRQHLALIAGAEITLEANPGTLDRHRLQGYRNAGITRLSLGVQSFQDEHLRRLGRIHDRHSAYQSAQMACDCFERVNLDLMYGLPLQTLDQAQQDVRVALTLGVSHLSCYQLTLEPNTPFSRTPPPLPAHDQVALMGERIDQLLAREGFEHYETSAYALAGEESRHNLNYWTFGDYLGLGAGAHGKITTAQGVLRQVRPKHPDHYLRAVAQGCPVQEQHFVTSRDLPFEFMMNALRLRDGVPAAHFERSTGLSLQAIQAPLDQLRKKGLLSSSPEQICATPLGQRFLNDVLQAFLE